MYTTRYYFWYTFNALVQYTDSIMYKKYLYAYVCMYDVCMYT